MRYATKRPYIAMSALVAGLIAVSSVFNLAAPGSYASSHREAPVISQDPAADNTDLYAFVSPDKPDTVTFVSNYYPGEDPAGGPNFYSFGDDVIYDIKIDNNGDAVADIVYRWDFESTWTNPNVPLYNTGTIETLDDEDLNYHQSYTVTKITADGEEVLDFTGVVPPVNIGPKSTPNYNDLAEAAITEYEGSTFFAGQRDDPFWVDLGGIFDVVNLRSEIDDLKGLNVQTIAIQVPIAELTATGELPNGADDTNAIIGVWSTASRYSTTVINSDGTRDVAGDLVQVSRLGMPLVNEVVVPVGAKDLFNASDPIDDAQFLGGVTEPILGGLLNALFGLNIPPAPRDDLVAVFLTGVPGLNQPANVVPSEMLRLNMAIAPAAVGEENYLGVIGGDLAGFPNGRRLGDDVVDIALRVVAGVLVGDEYNVEPNNALSDGIDANDKKFLTSFPYVAAPSAGFEHKHHRSRTPVQAASVTIDLAELNDSGMSGTATLTENGDKTDVVLELTGATGDHPVHIHNGSCENLGEVAFALTDIDADGKSETTVDISLANLTSGDYAINAHLSVEDIATYVACGDIS